MQLTLATSHALVAARTQSVSDRRSILVTAQKQPVSISRRSAALTLIVVPLLVAAAPASARNYLEAKKAAEERKEKLKEAAQGMRDNGVAQDAFSDSDYAVGEEAHTPNAHSRQEEGVRTQENV